MRALIAVIFALALAAPAQAATVRATRSVDRSCQNLRPAGTSVAHLRHAPARSGLVTVTLAARSGDWDLAVFSGDTRQDGAATHGPRERALAYASAGRALTIQACRRTGSARSARVTTSLFPMALPKLRERAALVRVPLLGRDAFRRLEALGLDVTHNHRAGQFADVVLYSAAERARLAAAGFVFATLDPDLRASTRRTVAQRARSRALPSGRTAYRTAADYGDDLKKLVTGHPGLVKPITIGESIEARPIEGVEIAGNVGANDGRPTFVVMGLHHAREWPSGEMPMEFATDLAKAYSADPRMTSVLDRIRVIVLPMINPDGFAVSRAAGENPATDDDSSATLPLALADAAAYKRKNCRAPADAQATPCAARTSQGVDLNRNYGAYWGGIGSNGENTAAQNYRGTAPYSEPEAEAVHKLSQTRNIVTIITHHTFTDTGVWLRQPGFCMVAPDGCQADADIVPDEAGMAALGDAMAQASGWTSELGWVIGEITGATEDWNYFAAGAYGYTPEQRGSNFHPTFANAVVAEYDGTAAAGGGGVREALLRAAEQTADRRWHSVIEGSAPNGRVLRLRKSFKTVTSQEAIQIDDTINLVMQVPESGRYSWDVNPSTRPLATAPESYTMTCELPSGQVLEAREVMVARGQTVTADFACGGVLPGTQPPASVVPSVRIGRVSARRISGTAANATRVEVGVLFRRGKRCQQLVSTRRLAKARSCRAPTKFLRATGNTAWRLALKRKLKRGSYTVVARATGPGGVRSQTLRTRVR